MRRFDFGPEIIMILCVLSVAALRGQAQPAMPYPRISEEAFNGRLPFFDYPADVPLEARVVQEWDQGESRRQKIVFRGAQGRLVPSYFELPKGRAGPLPVVLLAHGWSWSKDMWFGDSPSCDALRRALLQDGCAVMALDAATHGERSSEIDYQGVNPFHNAPEPPRVNYFSYAEIAVQTVKDYRRALDYLAGREDVDRERIGLVGFSMGGMNAFYLMAVEPRIQTFVACVPPLVSAGYGPAAPIDYTWGARGKSLLLLMGRQDEMGDPDRVQASYHAYMEGPGTKLIWYDEGHSLGDAWVPDARAWLRERLALVAASAEAPPGAGVK